MLGNCIGIRPSTNYPNKREKELDGVEKQQSKLLFKLQILIYFDYT